MTKKHRGADAPDETVLLKTEEVSSVEVDKRWKRQQAQQKRNIKKACLACPGFCCEVFALEWKKSDIPRLVRERKAWLKEGKHEKVMVEEHLRDLLLWKELLVPVRMEKGCAKKEGGPFVSRASYYYTCRAWSPETHLCTRYNDVRPTACPKYSCGEARRGEVPRREDMLAGHKATS